MLLLLGKCLTDKSEDLVTSLPGFQHLTWPCKVYSGLLHVPGPVQQYDSLHIHYQFHTSQRSPANDPVVIWHQGGPGGSSILVGLYGEMGIFRIGDNGNYLNPWAWNKFANMLYLESPAGSGGSSGFSSCIRDAAAVDCKWDDVTQAEAYAHTLLSFTQAFPEYAHHAIYLTGESYFGQYGPNIAHHILSNEPFKSKLNIKGIALGNACWGGNATCVACNGPSEDKIDVDFFFGKGLYSHKLHKQIYEKCSFPATYVSCNSLSSDEVAGHSALGTECKDLLQKMRQEVGPHNVYNVYDNCNKTSKFLQQAGKSMAWLSNRLRWGMHNPSAVKEEFMRLNGGYKWDCGGDTDAWILRHDVREALHLDKAQPGASKFYYTLSGPASITLYPGLIGRVRMLIFNGDADACVPYNGNEVWIEQLEEKGILRQTSPWSPWYVRTHSVPAGYITEYKSPNFSASFSFATVRLAGHMVPQFQPEPAFTLMSRFLDDSDQQPEVVV